jgi:hypothetical protein
MGTEERSEAIRRYLSLESPEIRETLMDLPGSFAGPAARPLLCWRLQQEEQHYQHLVQDGYVRMAEKAMQLIDCLRVLIAAEEGTGGPLE